MPTIQQASNDWLEMVKTARARKTYETYPCARTYLLNTLRRKKIDPEKQDVSTLDERAVGWLAAALKNTSPYTERAYLSAISGFYIYLIAERLINVNIVTVQQLIRQRARRPGARLPDFHGDEIDRVFQAMLTLTPDPEQALIDLRDRALIITLYDTGLRIHEALKLVRGDVDWRRHRAVVIGKRDKQAVIRFTTRSMEALKQYLDARRKLDGASGKPLSSLPVFARHDTGTGKQLKAITTTTGRNIVERRVKQVLGEDGMKRITPHSFRHRFVTRVLASTNNLKLAQALARHENIQITQRYAHLSDNELDRGYYEAIERG